MANADTNYVEFSLSEIENDSGKSYYVGTIGQQGGEGAWSYVFQIISFLMDCHLHQT